MTAPALLLAARSKLLAAEAFQTALAAGLIGQGGTPLTPWVALATDKDGRPFDYANGRAAITLQIGTREWMRGATSARYPRLVVNVWGLGDVNTGTGEWLARHVADAVVTAFDDPAGEQPKAWSADVYAISCRYAGDQGVYPVEGIDGLYRAEITFEIEVR